MTTYISMKQKMLCLLLIIAFFCIFPLHSVIQADYALSSDGYSAVFQINTPKAKVLVKPSFGTDGKISLNSPFSFSMNINDKIRLGELKPNGIVLQMLEPYQTKSYMKGFNENRFKQVSTPSLTTNYNGITIKLDNIELFSLRANKTGFGFSVGNENCFASVLGLDNTFTFEDLTSFTVDWNDLEEKTRSLIFIAGANSYMYRRNFSLSSEIFLRCISDQCAGFGTTIGMDLKLGLKGNYLTYRKRLGEIGDKSIVEFKFRDAVISYSDLIKVQPAFRGFFQERETHFKVSFAFGKMGISNAFYYEQAQNGEKKTKQSIKLSYKDSDYEIKAETNLNDFELSFSDRYCKVSYKGTKAEVTFIFPLVIAENFKGSLSINQNRQLSASFRYFD